MGLNSDPDDEELKVDEGAGEGGACIESSMTRRLWRDSGVCKVEDNREEEAEEETVDIILKERIGLYGELYEGEKGGTGGSVAVSCADGRLPETLL